MSAIGDAPKGSRPRGDRVTHAVQAIDALRLRLTHPTFNYVRLLIVCVDIVKLLGSVLILM
ncbi:hypothetical protein [Scytonema sp. HK-05]|uniref:hypothetical protein n=1 Tax=Scytonema sp. HK-05 TaxID=1137095 RepID=UPI000A475D7A|nr:hypothetical protein [Scytonema sp. HK-05]